MAKKKELGQDRLIWMYTQMVRIREFEERIKRTFIEHSGAIRGHSHLGDGAEGVIVGALSTRQENDPVLTTYRCHGYPIVLGTPTRNLLAEIFGRKDGVCKGFGGSMHLIDPGRWFTGTSGIVGAGIPHATGVALSAQVKNTGQVVYSFFGDGAAKQGAFYESLNMAAVWKLPIVYILENNDYQVYTHVSLEDANHAAGDPLAKKAQAFSIPGVTVDGTDVLEVHKQVAKAVDRARKGKGPTLIEAKFYRFSAHGNAITIPPVPTQFPEHEALETYGKKEEYEAARARDPITQFSSILIGNGCLTEEDVRRIQNDATAELDDAVEFALASPFPAPEEALNYVYA